MPKVQIANRSALFLSAGCVDLLEHARAGDWSFEYETHRGDARTNLVLYLMVPGFTVREPELVKLYMKRSETRWDEPGDVVAWDGNVNKPTLTGAIQTPNWTGLLVSGVLWSEVRRTDA